MLRRKQVSNVRFRRQHPIGPYFADFACHHHRVIIEVDGSQHADDMRRRLDQKRTDYLVSRGYRVLRFWNNEVLEEIEGVMELIYAALDQTERPLPPTPSPSPPREGARGEGKSLGRARNSTSGPIRWGAGGESA